MCVCGGEIKAGNIFGEVKVNGVVSDILTGDGFLTVCTEKKSLERRDRRAENEQEAELPHLKLPRKSETEMTHKLKTSTIHRPVRKIINHQFKEENKKKRRWVLMVLSPY